MNTAKPFILRIPAYASTAAKEQLPPSVPSLPQDPKNRSANTWYGLRCQDSWNDVSALLSGERGYVIVALKQCERAYVIPCINKDPLILLMNCTSDRNNTNLAATITMLAPLTNNNNVLEGLDQLPGTRMSYFTMQQIKPPTVDSISTEDRVTFENFSAMACPNKYKNYSTLCLPQSDLDDQGLPKQLATFPWLALCPRIPLINSSVFNDHLISVLCKKDSNAQEVAQAAREHYDCIFMQSKSVIRIFTRDISSADDLHFLANLPGVLKATCLSKTVWRPSAPSSTISNKPERARKETAEIAVRRVDGNPIAAEIAKFIAAHFKIQGIRMNGAEALGQMETVGAAQEIHGTLIGGAYVIAWSGGV